MPTLSNDDWDHFKFKCNGNSNNNNNNNDNYVQIVQFTRSNWIPIGCQVVPWCSHFTMITCSFLKNNIQEAEQQEIFSLSLTY